MRLLPLLPLFAVSLAASAQMLKSKDFDFELGKPYTVIDAPSKNYFAVPQVHCPKCDSNHTQLISQFGLTACKALYKCKDCEEPFDYFKCH